MKRFLILGLAAVAGCSSTPGEPTSTQEWMTLDQYKSRVTDTSFLVYPVVSVPEGAEVELRMSKKPADFIGERLDWIFYDILEPVEEQMLTVRLRAKKPVYLDLEHLLASTDKKSWMPLGYLFFPLGRQTRVTVTTGGQKPDVVVPVWPTFESLLLQRDVLSEIPKPKSQ